VIIRTERLDLIPMSAAFLRASLDGDRDRAAAVIGLRLPETWPDAPSLLALRLGQLASDPTLQPWLLRAMGLRQTGELVGYIGCHTAPGAPYLDQWSPGGVEFGFTVCPLHRRHGFAREAVVALMHWARDEHRVASFVLTISPQNEPSLALAASLGFRRVGFHVDEEDGLEDVFVLDAPREDR
jgi:RimJ/RimL family protein N-acetyltransferase